MRRFIFRLSIASFLWFALNPFSGIAQNNSANVIVQDLTPYWQVYSSESGAYIPYISEFHEPTSIHFFLDVNQYNEYYLSLELPTNSSFFINSNIIDHYPVAHKKMIQIDSLSKLYGGSDLLISIYSPALQPDELISQIIDINPSKGIVVPASSFDLESRNKKNEQDFFIISTIFLLAATALIRNATKNTFNEYFSFRKAISLKPKNDGIVTSSIFSTTNLAFHLFYGLIIGTSLVSILVWVPDATIFSIERKTSSMLLYALGLFLIFTTIMLSKFPLVSILGSLFNFHKFIAIHYYDYFRLTLIVTIIIFIFSITNSSLDGMLVLEYGDTVLYILVLLLMIRPFMMFIKLIKFTNHRKLHLFSYLCTTEIIPLIILLKIFLK